MELIAAGAGLLTGAIASGAGCLSAACRSSSSAWDECSVHAACSMQPITLLCYTEAGGWTMLSRKMNA
jgi:hypothetical protein